MDWFVDASVNQLALEQFFQEMNQENYEVHTMQIYQGDKQLLRVAQEPYSCRDAREIYSLSKMFCATVVGIAVDQGYLTTEDLVAEIFQRKHVSEFFSHLRVKHVLSMNTGHSRCVIGDMATAENVVDAFFSVEPEFEPGTHFTYNTGATCLLCAIVEKVTGRGFLEYACENLFYPLGITDISWTRCLDGTCVGGAGLHVCCDDIIKLGRLYAAGGVWNGRRIVSQSWIDQASSYVSDNSANENPDWRVGYGYQIWRNVKDGYRGDGAFGQLCMVLPGYHMVVAVQAVGDNMQRELDHIFALLDHLLEPGKPGRKFRILPPACPEHLPVLDQVFRMAPNHSDLHMLRLCSDGETVKLMLSDDTELQTVTASRGVWTENQLRGRNLTPSLFESAAATFRENNRFAAACTVKDGKIVLYIRYLSNPHTEYLTISLTDEGVTLAFDQMQGWALRPDWMQTYQGARV